MSNIFNNLTDEQKEAIKKNFADWAENDLHTLLDWLGLVTVMCPCISPELEGSGEGGLSFNLGPKDECKMCKGTGVAVVNKAAADAAEDIDEILPKEAEDDPLERNPFGG